MDKEQYQRFRRLLGQYAAPFRERQVADEARRQLAEAGVPFFEDPVGNVLVGVGSERAYHRLLHARDAEPVRFYIAHMDHPGFHVTRRLAADRLAVRWHGGSPLKRLNGARVWLAGDDGLLGKAHLSAAQLHRSGRFLERAEIRLEQPLPRGTRLRRLFGGLDFRAPVWRSGQRIYTRAADDLVGVFSIIETARRLFAGKPTADVPFIGLLSRAEEVGFVGAIAHFDLGWLARARRKVVAVSLEASRTLPGAEIGKGPVVRLGDRRTVFEPGAMGLLSDLAEKHLPGKHQRRIMDGGACEASAATAYGLPTVGLTVPLGNYHNQSLEGGPDSRGPGGPAPEFVHIDDVSGLLQLCHALMQPGLPWADPWAERRQALQKNLEKYQRLL